MSTNPPTVKPRTRPINEYDTLNEMARISRLTPQNVSTTATLQQHLHNPMRSDSLQSNDFPSEDDIFSLSEVVDKYSHLLPLRVKAVSGFMAENEGDPTIYVDDLYNLHAVKQAEVVTIVDSRRQKYRLPLNSAAKFGLICSSEASVYSVQDLHNAKTLPPVIAIMNGYSGSFVESTFQENEILLPIKTVTRKIGANLSKVIRVFSINERKKKYIPSPKECDVLFTTNPTNTQLFLTEIMEHISHVLPCAAQLFISQDAAKLPRHLTTKQVIVHQQSSETSVIISFHKSKSKEQKVYIDIPISINIDVRILKPESSSTEYASLYKDSRTLIEEYDPTKLQACVNANDDDTYITQAQLLKALRQGYEKAGTKIKTSGEEHIYQPLGEVFNQPSSYQDVVFPAKSKKQEPKVPTFEAPQYEDVEFRALSPPTVAPRASIPSPAQTLASIIAPQNKSLSNPVPLPSLGLKPKSTFPLLPTPGSPKQKAPVVPPKSTAGYAQNNKVQPSTVVYDRVPKRPVEAPVPKPKTVPKPPSTSSAEPVPSELDSGKPPHSHLKAVAQQYVSSPPLKVESPTLPVKTQPEASASNSASSTATPKEDQSNYGTALYAINESLRLLIGKIEKMEQKQTRFEEDISMLKSKDGVEEKQQKVPLEIHSMTQQDVQRLLDAMGMPQYKESFSKEWVDGEVFKELDDESLTELGVTSKLHRLKLKNVISGTHSLDKYL